MSQKNYLHHDCPIAQAMGVLGGQWTLLIVRDLMNGVNKFDKIQRSLKISRNLLAQRLNQMEKHGLTEKVVPEGLKRAIYKPTRKCYDLINTLLALSEWSEKWMASPKGSRISVKSHESGEPLQLGLVSVNKIDKYTHKSFDVNYGIDLKQKLSL